LSKIIRNTRLAPTIFVGEKTLDHDRQGEAAAQLARLFPLVMVKTDPDGARHIPIEEVGKMEVEYRQAQEEARQAGYESGFEAGKQEGLKKAKEVVRQFDAAIRDAIDRRTTMLEEARQGILKLVVQISRKVTFNAVEADPELTLKMISGVIDSLLDRSRLKIKVNPDHLPIVEQNIETFLQGSATIKEIKIEADPRVRYGGCFIETPTGDIDSRLESQFEIVEETIMADGD